MYDSSDFDAVLFAFPTNQLPGLGDLDQYLAIARRFSEGKEQFLKGVCYLVPVGGKEEVQGGEVDLLEATFHSVEVAKLLDGSAKYDDILEKLFHEVLTARYSKRPPRNKSQSAPKRRKLPESSS